MILYNYDLDMDCYCVRLVASCLGLDLPVENIDMFPGAEHLGPRMLASTRAAPCRCWRTGRCG